MLISVIITVLAVLLLISIAYILLMKHETKEVRKELELSRNETYNRLITREFIDKGQEKLLAEINRNIEYQNAMKIQAETERSKLKQSISDIAHDLRTPVTVIRGNLQMIEKSGALSGSEAEELRVCLDKSNDLKMMVDEFYELSYFESEDVEIRTQKTDLTEFVAGFIIDNEALLRKTPFEPEILLPDKSIFIEADPALLNRILSNLLTNVLRYSKEYLKIKVFEKDGAVAVEFENEAGDSDVDTTKIFERTYRADKVRTGGGPGGLGLYIVRLLSGKMNGEAYAANDESFRVGVNFPEYKS